MSGGPVLADLRAAARRLARAPGFTFVAALTLALGLAAATAVFALLDAVVLRPFRYPAAERLVTLGHDVPGVQGGGRWKISKANYFAYGRARSVEAIALYRSVQVALVGGAGAEGRLAAPVRLLLASPSLFPLVGARAQLGRLFGPGDVPREGERPRVAVLTDALWRARFGADPGVVGRTVRLDGDAYTVAGVLAPVQTLPTLNADPQAPPVGVWVPMPLDSAAPAQNAHMQQRGIARLRPGVTADQAARELAAIARAFPERYPTAYTAEFMRSTGFRPTVTPLRDEVVGPLGRTLWIVLGGAGVVLAVAGANVANLAAARREGRARDTAVRVALGAGRGRLVRDALADGTVLAAAATALALPLAAAAVAVTRALAPDDVALLAGARVDARAALVCGAAALAAAALAGALPLVRARLTPEALRDGGRAATAGRTRVGARQALVVGQVALALVLLSGAGLLAESVRRLRAVRPGFAVDGVLVGVVVLPSARYRDQAAAAAFWRALEERLAAAPGVRAAGATNLLPLGGSDACDAVPFEGAARAPGAPAPCAVWGYATPGFFRTLGIAVRGGVAGWAAVQQGAGTAVVTGTVAERVWPGADPLGRGVGEPGAAGPPYRVAGVTGPIRAGGFDRPPSDLVYFPVVPPRGAPGLAPGVVNGMAVVLRGDGPDPARYAPALRRALAELDPDVPLGGVYSMRELAAKSMARVSFAAALLGATAGLAALLAAVGLYGTLAYVVGLRARELGVRMALGARAGQAAALVAAQSARLALAGVALGALGALAATRVLRSLLFEVAPGDPRVLAAVAVLLTAVAGLASWLPARRAARVDPAVALRAE